MIGIAKGFAGRARGFVRVQFLLLAACLAAAGGTPAAQAPAGAAIASAHPLATAAGYEMLRNGGNAFDAAVAIAAALAVVEPYSSGLGGGGFWLLHRAADRHQVMLDARETAPLAATPSMYLDGSGKPIPGATLQGGRAAGIPGVPAGMVLLAQNYGRLPLARSLAPAIALARDGFRVDPRFSRIARLRERFLINGVNTARTFLVDQQAPSPGYLLRQPELAVTLESIAAQGRDGFYQGRVAQALVAAANAAGGVWSLADLEGYRVVERAPVVIGHRGATIVTAALPGGGVTLVQALNILEQFPASDAREPAGAHLVIEALRRAFQDRALYLGDSDFVKVPTARLTGKAYARTRAATIDPAAATPSERLAAGPAPASDATTCAPLMNPAWHLFPHPQPFSRRERHHGARVANCCHEPVVASLPSSPTLLPGGEGSVVLPAGAGRFMGRGASCFPLPSGEGPRVREVARVESGNTTHYSVIDADGNRVGATLSINFLFGAGVVAGDTGVLLNNEMDDFSLQPDVPNAYRLRSGEANRIEPRKRPLSSMAPTFVEDAKGVLVLGAPGGSRIVSQLLLGILDYLGAREIDLRRMVSAPRYHHQYWPDRVEIEPEGFSAEWRRALEAKHHVLQTASRKWGNMQVVFKSSTSGAAEAASDPRGEDIGWY